MFADVAGYALSTTLSVPRTTASRYVTDLAKISDTSATGEGCLDGKSGASLVLLDIGAQTITSFVLQHPGVALVKSNPVQRVQYPALVQA